MESKNIMAVYLHFGGEAVGLPDGPFQTMETEFKVEPLINPSETKTDYMVLHQGWWRRVLCQGKAPNQTYYIRKNLKLLATVQFIMR